MNRTLERTLLATVVFLLSCSRANDSGNSSGGVNAGNFDKGALLKAFGECALSGYREFQTTAIELDAASKRAEAEGTPAARDAAREAWKKAIDAWQRVESFQFGPAGMTGIPGGKDMRDPIYAWNIAPNRCQIEETLASKGYDLPTFPSSLVSGRTLSSDEYVLFYEGTDNGCEATSPINAQGTWAQIDPAELTKRKAGYARALAGDIVTRAQTLVDAWDPAKGNFLTEFETAGQSRTYATQQVAFNTVSDAMFFFDDEVKDMKIGWPSGLVATASCTSTPPCVGLVESPWAKRSKVHIDNNLVGYERLLRGCEGPNGEGLGFEELLVAIGAESTAQKLVTELADARAALAALKEPTFEDDLVKNPAGVKALYEALRALSVVMRTEFLTVLDLEIPKKIEGDND